MRLEEKCSFHAIPPGRRQERYKSHCQPFQALTFIHTDSYQYQPLNHSGSCRTDQYVPELHVATRLTLPPVDHVLLRLVQILLRPPITSANRATLCHGRAHVSSKVPFQLSKQLSEFFFIKGGKNAIRQSHANESKSAPGGLFVGSYSTADATIMKG